MDNNKVLTKYLKEHFKGVPLESPLFYNVPIGIRFELGLPYIEVDDPTYFINTYIRASMIFQDVFGQHEKMLVVVKSYRNVLAHSCYNQGEDVFQKYIRNRNLINQVSSIELEKHVDENGEIHGVSYQQTLLCKRDDVDYVGILKAKAHQDFAIKPYISDSVFFINPQSHVIFYMYDDRGMDLIAKKSKNLKNIYVRYNDWILKYDKEHIDNIFKT